jgi:hypothetical protein
MCAPHLFGLRKQRWQATDREAKKLADKDRKDMEKAHQVWYECVCVVVVHVSVVWV